MYVSYEEYQRNGGRLQYEAFASAEPKAEARIRYLTYIRGDVFAKPDEMVKQAVCAATDLVAASEANAAAGQGGAAGIRSESNDGYSVTYVTDAQEGQTAEEALTRRILAAVRPYLLPGGWLYRGVRAI